MVLQALFICLVLELLLVLFLFKGDILSPAIVFVAVFIVASLDLLLMREYWEVVLIPMTFWIIVLGVLSFITCSFMIERSKVVIKPLRIPKFGSYSENFKVSTSILDGVIIVYFVVISASTVYVVKSKGLSSTLVNLFGNYVISLGGSTSIVQPAVLSVLSTMGITAGYAWSYLFANSWVSYKKIEYRYVILIILSMVMGSTTGKRGEFVAIAVTLTVFIVLALKKNRSKKLSRKVYVIIALILLTVAASFQSIASIMGRDSNLFNPIEYFSIYLGAPILNLNTGIVEDRFNNPVFLSETFHSFYNAMGENFGINEWIYNSDRIFWSSPNGKRVGNVATVFYDFYHDGGLAAVLILCGGMGFFSQLLYRKIKHNKIRNKMFGIIVYGYVYWMVARSFFANSFYDWITLSTIKTLLLWWVYSIIIPKLKIKGKLHSYVEVKT